MMCFSGLAFTFVSHCLQQLITFLLRCSWCKTKNHWDVTPTDVTEDGSPTEGRLSFVNLYKLFGSGSIQE